MPIRPPRPCAYPGCPTLVVSGRCDEHRRRREREIRADQPWRDYGARWRRLRAMVLRREPACRRCGALATEVDHVVPLRCVRIHAAVNLQPLCKRCHSSKTAQENSLGGSDA